jgi:hypothetical protein
MEKIKMKRINLFFILICLSVTVIFAEETMPESTSITTQSDVTSTAAGTISIVTDVSKLLNVQPPGSVTTTAAAEEITKKSIPPPTDIGKKLLIVGDVGFIAATAFFWLQYQNDSDFYDQMFNDTNNTTVDNYNSLVQTKKNVEDKETAAWIVTGIASAFIIYTAADIFWLHYAFPVDIKTTITTHSYGLIVTAKY